MSGDEIVKRKKAIEIKQIEINIDRDEIALMEHDEKREQMIRNLEDKKQKLMELRGE